jgi:anaerobic selenocysteine-containing dehydrogenase
MATHASYCRICHASCGVLVDIDGGRIVAVRGDPANAVSRGFTCPKGRRLGDLHQGPGRLTTSLARDPSGTLVPIGSEEALDQIAQRLGRIVAEHGAGAVGMFIGTQTAYTTLTLGFARAWHRALGSPKLFSTMTIDQSAKWIAPLRMGQYQGGAQGFHDADVWMIVGANPLVSMSGGGALTGFPLADNLRKLREAKARGLRLIVIDPRRTETAAYADVHLQIIPGTDSVVLAGLLHVLLRDRLVDADFCDRYATGLVALRDAVSAATPEVVAARAGVTAEQIVMVAHAFGGTRRGVASSGTGPDMAPHSNLAEHLLACVNVVCGRYLREGEATHSSAVLGFRPPPRAQVTAPDRPWERGFRSRVGGYGQVHGELPTAILADEILEPGDDRIRALVVSGGNPAVAIPDQEKALRALRSLDLLVTIDPRLSHTARLADYVIAPTLFLERPDHTIGWEGSFTEPFAQYAEPLLARPGDVVEDWEVFWGLAERMGLPLKFAGRMLDMARKPTSDDLLEMLTERARVPLADVRRHPNGLRPEVEPSFVQPADPGAAAHRIHLLPDDVAGELAHALAPAVARSGGTHLLVVRRMREVMNSVGTDMPSMRQRPYNPAWMHPDDLASLDVAPGQRVEISSEHGAIVAVVDTDASMRPGVVSLTHAWGPLPGDNRPDGTGAGANPAALLTTAEGVEPINRMPTMTAVHVRIRPVVPDSA